MKRKWWLEGLLLVKIWRGGILRFSVVVGCVGRGGNKVGVRFVLLLGTRMIRRIDIDSQTLLLRREISKVFRLKKLFRIKYRLVLILMINLPVCIFLWLLELVSKCITTQLSMEKLSWGLIHLAPCPLKRKMGSGSCHNLWCLQLLCRDWGREHYSKDRSEVQFVRQDCSVHKRVQNRRCEGRQIHNTKKPVYQKR